MSYTLSYMARSDRRVNARIDETLARRLDAVARRTGKTSSQIIKESLARYCELVLEQAPNPAEALTGFIGSGRGPGDLSTTYKEQLSTSLARKHGHR